MIEPSGLRIGSIGPVEKLKQPQVSPENDPVLQQQQHNKINKGKKHGSRRA